MGEFKGVRQSGRTTPNKATSQIKEAFSLLVENNLERLQSDLNELDPKDRLNIILQFSRYVLPTLKAVEVTETDVNRYNQPLRIVLNGN
jgi:hypothetical protein